MNREFYNPYHFVPVSTRSDAQKKHDLPVGFLGSSKAKEVTHERYVPGTHSGCLTCQLTTKTPLVVGAQRGPSAPDAAAIVHYYRVQGPGRSKAQPAIPGSSLRGLLSSMAEAASNSSLRVLEGGWYSYRKPFTSKYKLSAVGMIVRDAAGCLRLRPLALPTLEMRHDRLGFAVPRRFKDIFPVPAFKVYIGNYTSIRRATFPTTSLNGQTSTTCRIKQLAYATAPDGAAYIEDDEQALHCKRRRDIDRYFVVAQDIEEDQDERSGFYRVLGCWGARRGDGQDENTSIIPKGKTHELWLPEPRTAIGDCPISPEAIQRFEDLADERTKASISEPNLLLLPLHPLDTKRNENNDKNDKRFRLKHGDFVYFDVDKDGTVIDISLSAIWRDQVRTKKSQQGVKAGARDFFHAVDPELVPFSPEREQITIAERMFGFVEERESEDSIRQEQGRALAGRILVSDALPEEAAQTNEILEEESVVPLRILSSPKPPSPTLYFKSTSGTGWVPKDDLNVEQHRAQGRKMYLHHRVDDNDQPWKTNLVKEHLEQKSSVRPIRRGQTFSFHIDYENLTNAELGLLLYALAPNAEFHHKLGMGKPLGLGSVKIEILSRESVDRQQRYTLTGLQSPRFHHVLHPSDPAFWELRDDIIGGGAKPNLVSKDIHDAICLLGDFAHAAKSDKIHTPITASQEDTETKTYEWFVANDGNMDDERREMFPQRQVLMPLPQSNGQLPTFVRPDWSLKRPRSQGSR